ncbi:type IV toxin-antitoxin system AbiEi family antitoxin domain-containing protein [Serinicoccus sp. CNJ-927]|uniref:type IV toxin-antitoxin system AbiEi family antitoxin domain-containing protein n=1 Tax=Serinicoccus sp. CNJ-927 TaxID=1904970 RepID=UPI001EDB5D90|nr:type IV toxin-antitoxin system AbiEi family antitoxin domain-containing protein [Serinicoccus sp. CNJ-927]
MRQRGPTHPELQAFLTTHHHVVTTREAAALGFNREVLRRLVQRKVLTRVARGAYVQTSVLLGHRHLADRTSCAPAPCSAGTGTGGGEPHEATLLWDLPLLDDGPRRPRSRGRPAVPHRGRRAGRPRASTSLVSLLGEALS